MLVLTVPEIVDGAPLRLISVAELLLHNSWVSALRMLNTHSDPVAAPVHR